MVAGTRDYQSFLSSKQIKVRPAGFDVPGNQLPARMFPFQRDICRWALRLGRAAVFLNTGLGKQQPVTEPVLTPDGWKTMGDLCPGDLVIGSNGLPTTVLGVFPQGVKRVYRLELSDGSFARAGEDHLWSVRTKTHKYHNKDFLTLTTREIAESVHRDWQLPMLSPSPLQDAELSVDPYALGVLLGDGCLGSHVHVCTDNWIGEKLGWRFTRNHETSPYTGYWSTPPSVYLPLEGMGLRGTRSHEKFVPIPYMHASPSQRLGLLQGLMDTDGYAMPDGGAEFCSTSRALVDSVRELAWSLGGVARGFRQAASAYTYNGQKHRGMLAWRINIRLPAGLAVFSLPRKRDVYVEPKKYPPARIIREVIDEGVDEEQVCIAVDAPDALYVTRSYILTHNTAISLAWADQICKNTGRDVLILCPLAVGRQTFLEAGKFGIDTPCRVCLDQSSVTPGITITNYEKLHKFDPSHFVGVVLGEASIIKNVDGKTRTAVLDSFRTTPFKLAESATPAPNDHMELGNHAEFIGVMSRSEMLATFFVHDGSDTSQWRLKGHAEREFWRWMAGWSVCIRKPSDLGYSDDGYILPPLRIHEHIVETSTPKGVLFQTEAKTLAEQRAARRETIAARAELLAGLTNADDDDWITWCNLNEESRVATAAVRGAVEITGAMPDWQKEAALIDFSEGRTKRLVTKPKICGAGLNWQHIHKMAFLGISHSWEAWYQAIRRCWRFAQLHPVDVHVIVSDRDGAVMESIHRKQAAFDRMGEGMVSNMRDFSAIEIGGTQAMKVDYNPTVKMEIPSWVA